MTQEKLPYSSPQAYLNRHFKKGNKFKYEVSEQDSYENDDFRLVWLEKEIFVVEVRVIENDTGADYWNEIYSGDLIYCVDRIKKYMKGY